MSWSIREVDGPRLLPPRVLIVVGLICAGSWAMAGAQRGGAAAGPLSPEQAIASFQLEPGYRIEVAAAEPQVRDPVAMAFDERGRLYVVESRGYPGPLEGGPRPPAAEGTIARLEDRDGDGRFETRTDFAGSLSFPNGILPWNGGVFVSDAPDLLFLKDTDGDGIADERRVVLTGFDASRTSQIRFSHPTLGIDNWIYLTSGLTGGLVTAPDHPERPAVKIASDSRFDPVSLAFEPVAGQGQYGLTFDDYGRRFTCSNRRPVMHAVLEPRYLQRNPHLAFSGTVQDVSTAGAEATVWPVSADMTTASFHPSLMSAPHAGTFTAASGLHIHRGDALPPGHEGSLFICESAQNLVQRQVRRADGVTFSSRPARTGREFLASADGWFRPVFAADGPDGALYIVDMYRKAIDHPQYIPEDSRALFDFNSGKDRGRIYRIVAADWKPDRTPVDLERQDAVQLARLLEHPNGWWRDAAQRLLVTRRDRSAVATVRTVAAEGRPDTARIHALWTLEGLQALEPADLISAIRDPSAAVRENAIRLAEPRLASSPDLLSAAIKLTDDQDARVRLGLALALGETADPRSMAALAALARRDGADAWARAAVLSSIRDRSDAFLQRFTAFPAAAVVRAAVMADLAQLYGAGQPPERSLDLILEITRPGADFGPQPAALAGLARGLKNRGPGSGGRPALMSLVAGDSPQARTAAERMGAVIRRASELALNERTSTEERLAAIGLLGQVDYDSAGAALRRLLAPQHTSEIQMAAVRALSQLQTPAAEALVDTKRWLEFTPQVRETVLSALLADEAGTRVLLDAVEDGRIAPAALNPARRSRLMAHKNAAIRTRASALLADAGTGNRMAVYDRLREPVLARRGNAEGGRKVFAETCAVCHSFAGAGGQLGPDLSGIHNQPPEAILLHVLVPDYEIAPGYQAYVIETRDRRTLAGRLESEAPNSLTLRDASSQSHVILRSQVVSMAASASSLMPNELERLLSEQDLADLIAYLRSTPAGGR